MTKTAVELNGPKGAPLVVSTTVELAPPGFFNEMFKALDNSMGLVLASNYEYPSRYSLWNFGLKDPIVTVEARQGRFDIAAHAERGMGLLRFMHDVLAEGSDWETSPIDGLTFSCQINFARKAKDFAEEDRTRKLSTFSVIRAIWQAFRHPQLKDFGLFGAFGYDLIFEFEDLEKRLERADDQRDVVLFIPDRIFKSSVGDDDGTITSFDFVYGDHDSSAFERVPSHAPFRKDPNLFTDIRGDHQEGEYEKIVLRARHEFEQGNLFETVPSQSFFTGMQGNPSEVFERLLNTNPSPYAFFMNLGADEYLIGASPEMFVRSTGRMIETCPISGTIPRGADPLEDSSQILALLSSKKDEAELTMCTDVDRNDKARVCVPGSIVVKGRRQIEMYSRLIHTVDHVVGELSEGYDALDAFISHMWAVTVTGAPKIWAVKFLEAHERSPRRWYAGAIGSLQANGAINTALTIRTVQVRKGLAEVRAGATTLYHSDPAAEEKETRVKASAFISALFKSDTSGFRAEATAPQRSEYRARGLNIVLVDHEDSFVNMLGSYFKIFEPNLRTYRSSIALSKLDESVDLIVMSPGPGRPVDFNTNATLQRAMDLNIPVFGVCLGLQATVEFFGGELGVLGEPCHGVGAQITHNGTGVFTDLPQNLDVARYHSLYALERVLPKELEITARSGDNVVMGIAHKTLPIHAVQFHPESIITSKRDYGKQMVQNVLEHCVPPRKR